MLSISKDGIISLTRGDTARFSVKIRNRVTNEFYIPVEGDSLVLTISKSTKDGCTPLIQKLLTTGSTFHLKPEDTKDLKFEDYVYDIQLNTVDGDVYTVITKKVFKVTEEVGR